MDIKLFSRLILALTFILVLVSTSNSYAEKVSVTGDVICLLPDYNKGVVNPVVANKPCSGEPAHSHILLSKEGKIYYLQGLQEGLMKIQLSPNHKNVTIAGTVKENPGGWTLFVE